MAEYGFSETHEMLRSQVQQFVKREIKPIAKKLDEATEYPPELRVRQAEMGYLGIIIPPQYGGQGLDYTSLGIVCNELARGHFLAARNVSLVNQLYLFLQEDEGKLQKWLPGALAGKKQLSWAITEPGAGSDAAAMSMKATKDGDYYVLNGEKTAISFAMLADTFLVWAKTDPTKGARGISCFLVPADLPGISKSQIHHMGWKGVTSGSLFFDNVRVPAENMVGGEGSGFAKIMERFNFNRVILSLEAIGLAEACLEDAMAHTKQRSTFGKPLAKHQTIAFKIAEDITLIEVCRLLCFKALWLVDQGKSIAKEGAMCKWFVPQTMSRVALDSLLMLGHYGYSLESEIAMRYLNLVGYLIADGTIEVQKGIISRIVMGREFSPF